MAACADHRPADNGRKTGPSPASTHPYLGMWVTADGRIRQELLPTGRYEEERDGRKRAYTGRYTVTGTHIDYVDDLGFTATGDVRDGVLYHEHLVLYRER
ncbi:Atu4866 domain-containing protein [Kibdelosporangium persicum]|uniref:Atu4866 domain-containing protein n=1 Tax=Kibdelosporangium persicum TaxID=2698649 RepID=UPI0035E42049